MLHIARGLLAQMSTHARQGGEHEVCGVLLGMPGDMIVRRIVEGQNVASEPRCLFTLDPATLLHADREARGQGWEIVGFYHSHPNHPPFPSALDRATMWPELPTLIITVDCGGIALCGWQQREAVLSPCLLQIED